MSEEAPVTRWTTAAAWLGLILFLGWQEFYVEIAPFWPTPWWFRVPVTLMLGLVILVFALECVMGEMTVRRWATSLLVFAVFGFAFLAAGIFDPDMLQSNRWVLLPLGVFYLVSAGVAGVGTKDSI